jgi:hypothetical protein
MERISGLKLHEVNTSLNKEVRKKLSDNVIEVLINMFVRDGFFHADLHPGNIFFHKDETFTLIDVGMFGELSKEQRERFLLYWLAIVLREKKRAFHHLLELTKTTPEAEESAFYQHYSQLLDDFYESSIQEKSLTQTYLEILISGAQYGFVFPSEMLLQAKALTTAENIGYVLEPGFNFAKTAKPIITKAFAQRLSSNSLVGRLEGMYPEWLLLGETAPPSLLSMKKRKNYLWRKTGEEIAKKWDNFHEGEFKEVRHGEYSVEINKELSSVFNFVTRFSQYAFWHPVYTPESHVIHVSGDYIVLTPEVVGSVFRLDEIVDGYHLLSNAEITDFKRNEMFKWKAPFSLLPLIELGTCLSVEALANGKTKLSEYFYFSKSPLQYLFASRKWFTVEALTNHIQEELTGVKNILERGSYSEEDVTYLWEDLDYPVRIFHNKSYSVDHIGGGPLTNIADNL